MLSRRSFLFKGKYESFESDYSENESSDEDSEVNVEDEDPTDESDDKGFNENENLYVTIGFKVKRLKRCTQ